MYLYTIEKGNENENPKLSTETGLGAPNDYNENKNPKPRAIKGT